jgi:molecular chaperone GrpE
VATEEDREAMVAKKDTASQSETPRENARSAAAKKGARDTTDETVPASADPASAGPSHEGEATESAAAPDAPAADETTSAAVPEPDAEAGVAPEPDPAAELRRERDALQDRWLRTVAELDNLRRRSRREVEDARRFAAAEVLRRFLEVQDNLERALGSIPPAAADDPGDAERRLADLRTGVELIAQSFRTVLVEHGVHRIDALGAEFDPAFHEAVGQRAEEGAASGTVVEVLQDGYVLGELILRPSRVIVAP